MCGICGYINFSNNKQDSNELKNMVNTLHHRGPDSQGYFEDMDHQVFLGHARLSIIDISANGKQPMSFGNLTIVFNGEIYNYREIKKELSALSHSFKTNSDTEVILHSYQEWGADCVKRFIGMFAFCIYDAESLTISLFRDRAGVKPLYYYSDNQTFIFGSELKVFHQNPLFHKELNVDSLGLYMKYGYIPTPYCVFKDTHKLVQGSYLVFDVKKRSTSILKYWELKSFYLKPKLELSYEEALDEMERVMTSAFKYRMVSDVPVGVFLSAGFDSTCVAALLQKDMTDKLRTFTIGFDAGNNEAPMAKEIAAHIGTDHTEYYCSEEDALNITTELPYYYDEPFADSSAIPTILVSRMARQQVKVALSADGGDEIFAGYDSYASFMKGYKSLIRVPGLLKKPIGHLTDCAKYFITDPIMHRRLEVISKSISSNKDVASSLNEAIKTTKPLSYLGKLLNVDTQMNDLPTVYDDTNDDMTVLSRLLYSDYFQYMQDDVLVKVDRASMSTSLEGRNPLLDHRIVEFAAQLSDDYKYHHGVKKRILKDIVYKYIPNDLIDKPKTGFSVPLVKWLNYSLKEFVDHYMSETVVNDYGVFNYDAICDIKNKFNQNNEIVSTDIWRILQFQMWFERWM